MYTILIVLIIITAILLMLVVLAQNPKGGGLSSQFGGSGTTQLMGVKKTGDFLEKATWTLIVALFVFTLWANVMVPDSNAGSDITSPNLENAGQAPASTPAFPSADDSTDDSSENLEDLLADDSTSAE
ncbi:MAG: preprotein translocase subunit SecG [Cyclobacteriaceae bacterium]